jgi:hypothetical protein
MSIPGVAGVGDRTLSSLLRGIRVGIFGTLAVLQKKETPRKPWIVYILAVVQFFQMLHFVRSSYFARLHRAVGPRGLSLLPISALFTPQRALWQMPNFIVAHHRALAAPAPPPPPPR